MSKQPLPAVTTPGERQKHMDAHPHGRVSQGVTDTTSEDEAFTSPSKKRSQAMPNLSSPPASSQLTVLPQPQVWSSQHLQPHANLFPQNLTNGTTASPSPEASHPSLEPQPLSPTLQGHSRLLVPVSEPLVGTKESHNRSQLHQKWYDPTTSSTASFPPSLIPRHKFTPQPGAPYQVNGTPDSTDQARPYTLLAITDSQRTTQPSKEPTAGMPKPPPLIPLPRVEAPAFSHSSNVPHGTQAPRWVPHKIPNPSVTTVLPYAPEPPRERSLQGHYPNPRAASLPSGDQMTAVFALRMNNTDPAHKSMVLIPASMSHRVHSTVSGISQIQQSHQPATAQNAAQLPTHQSPVPSRVIARARKVPSNTIWIVDGQRSSELPFTSASQPSRPTFQHYLSALPSAVTPSSQSTSTSSRQEVPQDLSISPSSIITQSPSSASSAVRQGVSSSLPVSSSQLSLLLTAGVPLVPVSASEAATSAHNTVTTITRAPLVSTVPIQASKKEDDDSVVSYETKKSKAVKSRKQKYLQSDQVLNGQVKKIKVIEKEVESTMRPDVDSYTAQPCMLPVERCLEDTIHSSASTTANTLPSQEPSTTPIIHAPMNVLKEKTTSRDQPEVRSKPNYVAVISITPPTTTTITTTLPSTTTPTSQTTVSTSATSHALVNCKTEKSHGEDLPNGTVAPSSKELSLTEKVSSQDNSTKTPFILVPKKRLRVLMEPQQSSIKGTPISVVKQLREPGEIVGEGGALPRSSIIYPTSKALKDSPSKSEESEQSLEKPQGKEAAFHPTTPASSASLSGNTTVILKLHATTTTTVTTTTITTVPEVPTRGGEGAISTAKTIATPSSSPSQTPLTPKKHLKKLVVQVERLTQKSFTNAFLVTHNVSAACGARLCRHLRVLQGAGQYHRPLNRRRFTVLKTLPVLKAPPARKTAPSPEIPRPEPPRAAETPTASPDSTTYLTVSPSSSHGQSTPGPSRPKLLLPKAPLPMAPLPMAPPPMAPPPMAPPPMAPAKISEAAGILHINSLKRRRLIVFRNKRLQPNHLKLLLDLGLDQAKKAAKNSTLDSLGARGTILDPGYFGIKGTPRPSQKQPSQESQAPDISQQMRRPKKKTPTVVLPSQTQPPVSLQEGNVHVLQQQQYHVPPARVSVRAGESLPVLRAVGGPHPTSRTVLVHAMGHPQGTRFVMVDQRGQPREAFTNPVPHGYNRYPAPAPHPEGWTSRPQVSRDSLAPPLMFMGPLGMGAVSREHVQQARVQPTVPRTPSSRAVPPPLSFMGHSTDTNSWVGPQHSQQPAGLSWPRLVSQSSRSYPVINHTKQVIPNKAPPTYYGPPPPYNPKSGPPPSYTPKSGPLLPYTPKSSYSIQELVSQGQPHSNITTTATPRPNPNSHQLTHEWQGSAVLRSNPHPQEHNYRVTTTAVCYPPRISAAERSSEQPGRTQQTATVSGMVQGDSATTSIQQVADPGPRAASSTSTTTTGNVDSHQCHQTWLPEVMAVVEALLLQLVDAGLPTRESFITHTIKQLLYARPATVVSAPFCCTAQENRWYQEFYNAHSQRLKAQEDAKQAFRGLSRDEVREWLTRLKVEMTKFYGVPPQRIYYMHELNFFLDQQTREVKYHRMFPGPPMMSPGSKDTISVLFILGADGQLGPGMIIFPRMVIPERLFESLRSEAGGKEWVLGSSANGWLTRDCVLEFVSDVFVPWLRRRAVHFPTALFSSEHISGVSVVPVADRFVAQGVQLISVPREVAGVLSPAEWIMGYRLRWHWGRVVKEWSNAHDSKPLLEENFAPFIVSFLTGRAIPNKVTEKFVKFGICPFDPQAMFHFLLKYHSMSSKIDKSRLQNGS